MSAVISHCDRCKLAILEGESYAVYGGNVLHSQDKCIERLQFQVDALREAAKALTKFYAHIWDRVDGCIVLHPESVDAFEAAHAALEAAIEYPPPATSEKS